MGGGKKGRDSEGEDSVDQGGEERMMEMRE